MSVSQTLQRATLPRLLQGVRAEGATGLADHLTVHGELPPVAQGTRRNPAGLFDELELAGLRGRGGAGFATSTKMRAVAQQRGRPIVVVNAAEGEPPSLKDRTLLEALPHLVLDGASIAAQALGARDVIVAVCKESIQAHDCFDTAVAERERTLREPVRWHLATLPDRYVAGQESALVSFLNGGPAKPTFTPPMPFESGVRGRPTLVNNPETLAHVALIARHGHGWFRELGTDSEPGSTLVTLSGPVAHPGVYEIEVGSSLASVIEAAGGLTQEIRASLIGGYAGAWVDASHLPSLTLSNAALAPLGGRLGAGVVALLPDDGCGLAETARVARWLAEEGAGQCGPCIHGLDALAGALERALTGQAAPDEERRLGHLTSLVTGRGACRHPDGTALLVASALSVFATELQDHMHYGPCPACLRPPNLPIPAGRLPRTTIAARPRVSSRPRARAVEHHNAGRRPDTRARAAQRSGGGVR